MTVEFVLSASHYLGNNFLIIWVIIVLITKYNQNMRMLHMHSIAANIYIYTYTPPSEYFSHTGHFFIVGIPTLVYLHQYQVASHLRTPCGSIVPLVRHFGVRSSVVILSHYGGVDLHAHHPETHLPWGTVRTDLK